MGRQIQICTTELDNSIIHDYLIETFDCVFFQSFAPEKDQVFVNGFYDTYLPNSTIRVWFRDFDWHPSFKQTSTKEKLFYIENTSNAPIIELSKTNWQTNAFGRLYWSKNFAGNPEYNVTEFEVIYNDIIKWVKQNSEGKIKDSGSNIYFLKEAWTRYNREHSGFR